MSDAVPLGSAFSLLANLNGESLVLFFWYTLLIEVPRYLLGAFAVTLAALFRGGPAAAMPTTRVSVIVAAHNEGEVLERCVQGLHEQTLAARAELFQIVAVSDGSTDGSAAILRRLEASGAVSVGLSTHLRSGKSAAVNLALGYCEGDIVFIIDADTSFDRDAFARMLEPFADPSVGAVSGNLLVRNAFASITTRFQAIEYLISISLGRRVSEMLGVLSVVSGAFGAFRRRAVLAVGGQDAEVGEDADLTTKLRNAGWRIAFQPTAIAMTDVPESLPALVRQRLRWDRSVITIWARKFRRCLNPFAREFQIRNAIALIDAVFSPLILGGAFVIYLVWILSFYGDAAPIILGAAFLAYVLLAAIGLLMAIVADERWSDLGLLAYVPCYCFLNGYVLRLLRLWAFFDELAFRASYRDSYVPGRVMNQVERF